ncbi:hypothetical protein I302_107712 [Kwoniella bestiolae CBS 10118]|uniref:Uncharacterized protein n=1 Tax=Kwoniella bestiolae CBS 10118 TaxID=1296100 RepID=A0A1B9FXS4_9TREE|nr:hypothetical protein I302_06549 [Kwoniella bestiolae CBS 10118]OCF23566.1 hypothetical protein I302_06549 [Kwoniella bestiolae CBS 10118]
MSKFPNLTTLLTRRSNPSIIPISPTRAGNNKPKSLQKTKRTFKPNITRVDWPVNLLSEESAAEGVLPRLRGVKMQVRRVRDVEKAGGMEGLLLSRRSKDLTPFGAYLRSQVFTQLHRIKEDIEFERASRKASGLPPLEGLGLAGGRIGGGEKREVPLLEGQ